MTTTDTHADTRIAAANRYHELLTDFANSPHGFTEGSEMKRAWEVVKIFIMQRREEDHPIEALVAIAGITGIMAKFVCADPNIFSEELDQTCARAADWLEELNPDLETGSVEALREGFMAEFGDNAVLEAMPPIDGRAADNVIELHQH